MPGTHGKSDMHSSQKPLMIVLSIHTIKEEIKEEKKNHPFVFFIGSYYLHLCGKRNSLCIISIFKSNIAMLSICVCMS